MNIAQKAISKISRKITYAKNDIGNLWGGNERLFSYARGARIVVYHGLCEEDPIRFNNSFLTSKTFEDHLKFYNRYFHPVSLDDYYKGNFSADKFNICITFDDGYENNYKYALPLLEKYKTPAAFFITAAREAGYDILWNDFLGIVTKYGPGQLSYKGEPFRKIRYKGYVSTTDNTRLADRIRAGEFDLKAEMMQLLSGVHAFGDDDREEDFWRLMTGEQISEMAASRWVTIGAHGYYHNDLAQSGIRGAAWEMAESRRYLQTLTGKAVTAIAFPYGAYDRQVVSAAKACGFSQMLSLDFFFEEDRSDPVLRERFVVNPFVSVTNQMFATIKRTYAF
jgi:peptidoglycan/xylan/chitin deacetylase (PgdA/CDA1 family)